MPELPKIIEDKKTSNSSNIKDEKQKDLIIELSDLLDKIGEDYGPFLMEELLRRLEVVVENFNEELMTMIKGSFKKWKIKDSQLRKLMSNGAKTIKKKKMKESSDAPDFIKGVKFGPLRSK